MKRVSTKSSARRLWLAATIAVGIGIFAAGSSLAEVLPRTVALSGEYAPRTNKRFSKFVDPIIDSAGRVAFSGQLRFDDEQNEGLWSEYQGTLQLMVRKRTELPVPSPQAFFNFSNWQVYGDGQLAFSTGSSKFTQGGPGSFKTVTRPLDYDRWAVNDSGQLAYVSENGESLIRTSQDGDQTISAAGQTLPGLPAGLTANVFGRPAINDAGNLAFQANVKDATGPVPGGGIWKTAGDALAPVALVGAIAPGAPDGRRFTSMRPPSINTTGDVAFQATVEEGAENGVWRTHQGELEMVAYRHQAAPGVSGDIDFDYFYPPAINDAGDVAFRAVLKGDVPSQRDNGLWTQHEGQLRLIARAGMAAPDSDPQAILLGGFQPQINNAGQLVFLADVLESPLSNSLPGIFAYSVVGDYLWSIRAGDELEVADNDFRTVANVQFPDGLSEFGVNTTDGHRSSLNDAGQLVFIAQFTDQSSGVFMATLPPATGLVQVPEPTTASLLVIGAVALLVCNRRRAGKGGNHA